MPEPLDPLTFLRVAQELARQRDEAALRTAIGRAYYALFLVARDKTGVTSTRAVHTEVIRAVRKRPGYRAVADQFDALRRLRVVADYQLLPDDPALRDWPSNWVKAQALINHILPKLQVW
ncbi:MAG: hypothetical protein HY268_30920 [Deltaproteobacteria bacterium]|nr:hypothetical protein [Deltaproteobacteria bacterium]